MRLRLKVTMNVQFAKRGRPIAAERLKLALDTAKVARRDHDTLEKMFTRWLELAEPRGVYSELLLVEVEEV